MAFKLGELNAEVEGQQERFQALKILLSTEAGTLAGDPRYGVNLANYLPYREADKPAISSDILNAVGRYMPDIRVRSIDIVGSTVNVAVENLGTIIL